MIKILKTPEFENICPHFVGAAIEARVTNSATNSQLWEEIEKCCQQLRADFTTESIKHRSGIAATRQAYKAAGKDPSRYRPACEQLARRILQGKELYAVNTLVDLGNLVSLRSGYATAALDADKIEGEKLTLSLGTAGEPYEGIGRGVLNIENLPVYRDSLGGIATPPSDNIPLPFRWKHAACCCSSTATTETKRLWKPPHKIPSNCCNDIARPKAAISFIETHLRLFLIIYITLQHHGTTS